MSQVIIFGTADLAELAHYYLTHDSEHEVVAFTVHKKYLTSREFKGLPVVPFESIESQFSNERYKVFAPMTSTRMNKLRETVFNEIINKGYDLISYVSSKATVFDNPIGRNCFILEDNTIQPFTTIGDNVILWSGNHIGHHGRIDNHVFFTSHVVMSGHCHIKSYSFIGVNASIRDGVTIGQGSLVSMGANVLKDTEDWGVYIGNPAKKMDKPSIKIY